MATPMKQKTPAMPMLIPMPTTQWPVIDYIGMVDEINLSYKQSHETFYAALCYQQCMDLLAQISEHGFLFIAHTHLILALLSHPKDDLPIPVHLTQSLTQIRTLLSLPFYASRLTSLDPLNSHTPYTDITLLNNYTSFISTLHSESLAFFSERKWRYLNTTTVTPFRELVYTYECVDKEGNFLEMRKKKEPMLPLTRKTEEEMGEERWEGVRGLWRYMGRELMKGGQGQDVRQLGGAQLKGFGGKGVFEFWGEVKEVLLWGYGGYGGVREEVWMKEKWGTSTSTNVVVNEHGDTDANGDTKVRERKRDRMDYTHDQVLARDIFPRRINGCHAWCRKCQQEKVEMIWKGPRHGDDDNVYREDEEGDDDGELKFRGYASTGTSGCGYRWDF
ncbi:hypothetical protein SBOR_8671 [Sclerotinia borealis F-4128]|uniref:Uncharacterized protein n=1 Tax=Sclerotinia borealis (strain F-4128) TaxID=1432307 RepID=W9C5F6_SCLBF|nr:hypothetical protein SBOR_8671 [Sclerotinia borealis F-4128]